MNAHEVKPVRLIQSLCAVCGSNLAGLTLLYIVLPCVADVSIVNCAVYQQFHKRTLLLQLTLNTAKTKEIVFWHPKVKYFYMPYYMLYIFVCHIILLEVLSIRKLLDVLFQSSLKMDSQLYVDLYSESS